MSLIIVVPKEKVSEVSLQNDLFEKVIELEDYVHYVPMPGKLAEILNLFTQNSVVYHITSAQDVGITDQLAWLFAVNIWKYAGSKLYGTE